MIINSGALIMQAFTEKLISHRKIVTTLAIILTLFWGLNLVNLRIDGGFTSVLPESDPDFLFNQSIEEEFGSADEIIILISNDDGIYSRETTELITGLSEALADISEIEGERIIDMVSLYGFNSPQQSGETEQLAELENFMRNDPLAAGTINSSDGKTTMILAPVSGEISMEDEELRALVRELEQIVEKARVAHSGFEILLSGHPVVNAEIMDKMANDLYLLFPIAITAVALMLLLILRSLRGMLIPLVITLMSVIWTFGLKGLLHSPLTITETVIPVILISISCADGIHIVSEAFHFMHHGMDSKTAIVRTIGDLWKPVTLTSLTTALGFASFIFSSGRSLRNMGLFLAFGVITAMIFSLFFIPVLFSWYKPTVKHENRSHYKRQFKLLKLIEHATEFFLRWRLVIIVIAAIVLGLSAFGMMNINTDTDEIRYFKEGNPIRQTAELIETEMGGLSMLQIILEGQEDSFRELSVLRDMETVQKTISARPEVSSVVSLADTVSYMYYLMRGRSVDYFEIPDNQNFINRLLLISNSGEEDRSSMLSTYVNDDFSRARIMIRITDSNTRVLEKLLSDIDSDLDVFRTRGLSVGFAGDYLRVSNSRIIVESQVLSLTITLGIILIVLSIIYRSLLHGLIVSMPVVIAVLFNFAVMWLLKVSLNPATAIIAAVGLGVGIDYSIHIYSRLRLLRERGESPRSCIVNSATESARGIISNAASVGVGFLILLLSAYRIINDMGWIIALTMLTTSLSSLILLPCLLSFLPGNKPSAEKLNKKPA
ncbi:MAG: efflux RND transporter permease subunit [Spirochaetales bacterium]|uniref:Efflux RND transporter permease subunit n=1 Tax=Candidatus Thalassospirochaeta sargassi TaxID=3119039 RepID=A0AAJ1IFF7_9SPIO|nr:efflux RND transporter permease subunit [Spirochaetales bacterium]